MASGVDVDLVTVKDAARKLNSRVESEWRLARGKAVQSTCDVVKLVADFLDRSLTDGKSAELVRFLRQDKAYTELAADVGDTLDTIDNCLNALDRGGSATSLAKLLGDFANQLCDLVEQAISAYLEVAKKAVADDIRLAEARDHATVIAGAARKAIYTWRLMAEPPPTRAADKAAREISHYYDDHAKRETSHANRLRFIAGSLLALIAVGALVITLWLDGSPLGEELVRLSATVPIAVLAGYLARESARHRASARWAGELAIAMSTLADYTEPLGEQGIELRRVLGMRMFGQTEPERRPDGLYDDVTALVDRLNEALRTLLDSLDRLRK
ncbi:hypothetical protein V5P93_005647 [Actinokineospora auranticolor]|uniref:Uncharacterized protein n=1 Tax=Actinokineospora auranticolor TaxID=155976 RepID=A0A2S6GEW6_9PSEU|nr:hypothetical protein [Actinokineospora auranticolor]PPK63778.1 hypothetical protein CLV40_12418 [Actinokineospora auranticolor]